jgi:hypothetical protein
MAIVGDAIVVVRAITKGVGKDIKDGFKDSDGIGNSAGQRVARGFSSGFKRANPGRSLADSLRAAFPDAEAASRKYQSILQTGFLVGPAISGAVSSIGALGASLGSLVGVLGAAAPAAVVLGSAFAAIVVGAVAAKLALGGVGQALSKFLNPKSAQDNKAAARAVEDARRSLALVIERNVEALSAADKALEKAADNAAKAQDNLTKAIAAGREEIQQLGFDAEEAAISEQKAAIELERARETLARTQNLPVDSRARREAQLAFNEAELNARRATDRNSDLAAEQERLAKEGVNGLDSVKAAQEAQAAAAEALDEARIARLKTIRDGLRAQADAERALTRAQQDAAKKPPTDAWDKGLNIFQKNFVKFLAGLKPYLDDLKLAVSAALLPKLQDAITTLTKLYPTFRRGLSQVASALGDAAKDFADIITGGDNASDFAQIFQTSAVIIRKSGRIFGKFFDGILSVLAAADPLVRKFFDFLEKKSDAFSKSLNMKQANGELAETFRVAGEIAADIGEIFGNIGSGIGKIITANTGPGSGGQILLDYFKDITFAFENLGSADGGDGLKKYFADAAENTKSILGVLGEVVAIILRLGADPNVKIFWDKVKESLPYFESMAESLNEAGPAMGDLVINLAKLLDNITESGSINAFIGVLNKAATAINKLFENELFVKIFNFTAKITGTLLGLSLLARIGMFAGNVIAGAFIRVAQAAGFIFRALGFLIKATGFLLKIFGKLVIAMLKGLFLIGKAMYAALGPWGLIIAGVVLLGIVIYKFRKQIKEFVDKILGFFKDLYNKLVGNSIIPDMVNGIIDWIKGMWEKFTTLVKDGIAKVITFFKELPGKVLEAIKDFATKVVEFVMKYHPIAILARYIYEKWPEIVAWFQELPGRILTAIKDFATRVIEFVNKYHPIAILMRYIQEKWPAVLAWFQELPGKVLTAIKNFATSVNDFVTKYNPILILIRLAKEKWPEVSAWFSEKITAIVGFFKGLPDKMKTALRNLWDGLKDGFKDALNFIIKKWNGFKLEAKFPDNFIVPGLRGKGFTLETPNIPLLARGGIVPATRGGMAAIIGEGGRPERVEPLDSTGLSRRDRAIIAQLSGAPAPVGGINVTVNPSPGMNEIALAHLVSRRVAWSMRKGV